MNMKRRTLGSSGIECSAIGYGAMSIAGIYGEATREEAFAVLDACLENGIDHIDTANVYGMGKSETVIGEWFSDRGADAKNAFSIATKATITRDPDTGGRKFDNSRTYLESELDKSLKRLGVETVDLFYIHRRDPSNPVEELAETLKDLVATGKCRSVGISEVAPTILRRLNEACPIAAVQSEYSLSTRSPELGLVQTTAELDIALVGFSPVGRGLLTNNPPTEAYVEASGFMKVNPRFTGENYGLNIAATAPFRALAEEMGYPAAGLAVAWLLSRGEQVMAIPGTRSVDHLKEAILGAYIQLSPSDLEAIETALPIGWAHGDRYAVGQWIGPERYC